MKNYRHRMLSVVLVLAMLLAYVPMQGRAEMTTVVETIDFNSAADAQKLDLYKTSGTGFTVQNGQLVPTGANGEFKAMFPDNDHTIQSVSVELHPVGANGPIYGGLYIGASNPANGQDQINAIYIGVESHFTGWSDALNRVDLVVGQFPTWKEHSRLVSETGAGNALFSGSMKQPLMLRADIVGNRVDITLSLVSNPAKKVTTSFTADYDLSQGQVGIRSHYNNATYDNLTVAYLGEQENTEIPDTDVVTFETAEDAQKFNLYHSSQGGFAVSDGKLVPTGNAGQFKAIYKDENASFSRVSVDIYPGTDGIDGGLYLDVTDVDHPVDQISALSVLVQSNFTGWSDAPNRTDLVIGTFPQWKELHRTISETGAGNSLFVGGKKEPVNLRVEIEGNRLTITLRLLSNPAKFVSTVYEYTAGKDIALGNVGIRSQFSGASYDNFAVVYEQVEQDKEPDGETPTEPSEPEIVPTDVVDFTADNGQFAFYHSSNGGFAYQDGQLVSTGEAGQNKAIYEDENASFSYVSVDIYPGEKGMNGGLYLDVTDVDHPVDQITGLYVGIEADFPHEGETPWPDAPNRLDLVVGKFPAWQELHRTISEPGAGNALFTGGNREPVKLSVALEGNTLTIRVALISNPKKFISVTYEYAEGVDIALGNVGIRSQFSDASFDNFAVVYTQVEEDKENDPTAPEGPEPTDVVDCETDSGKFQFYHSADGGFMYQDGKLINVGEPSQNKAIYRDDNASFSYVSVDIYPGEKGINGGLYLDATDAGHGVDQINALYVGIEADFPHEGETPWPDAPNRLDLVVGKFPAWQELHRTISEPGAGNALFTGGNREPVKLSVALEGNQLTITVQLLSNPKKFITVTYEYAEGVDIALGNVGIRSQFSDASFDNFCVVYEQVEADKEPDPTPAPPPIDPTELIDFESADQAKRFDFYHSSKGGFQVQDGMLVPTGETGEFKAIYRDGGSTVDGLCVDIFPGESGQINSGVYIGTSTVEHGADMIKGLVIMVESNHSGWDDAVNRIDLVVGRFPVWRELHRYTSETGANNALFAGQKEPLRLQVDIRGKQVQITLSLLSDPDMYVTTVYEFNGATDLSANNVGLRSANNDVRFDNFAVHMTPGGGSADIDPSQVGSGPSGNTGSNTGSNAGNNSTPNTGDSFRPEAVMLFMTMSLFCLVLVCRKRKTQ